MINNVTNRNQLTKVRFKFVCSRIPNTIYFCQSINIPGISLGVLEQPTPILDIPQAGTKLIYEDLNLNFIVNENLANWNEIKNWMNDIAFDNELSENNVPYRELFSDGCLILLSDKSNPIGQIDFQDMFPTKLTGLEFDIATTTDENVTCSVSFKYLKYTYTAL